MSLIKISDITRVYGAGESATVALDKVSLEIKKGEFVAIMGPSGSGKSTLMNVIGLLDRPNTGIYELSGEDVAYKTQRARALIRREKIGFIFQSFNLLPRLTALDNVAMPLTYQGMPYVARLEKAAKVLKSVDLEKRQYYMPNQLSGGQVQRVAIARALVNDPALILADEPTGNLDTKSGERIMDLLKEVHKKGNTIVMVTHDEKIAKHAERIVHMVDGRIDSDTATKSDKKKPKSKKSKKKSTSKKSSKSKSKKTKKATKK